MTIAKTISKYERELLERAARWPRHRALTELSAEALQAIAEAEGIDFATALLHDRVLRSPVHGPFVETTDSLPHEALSPPNNVTLAIVPGARYVESPGTGADGRLVRDAARQCNWPCELIPTASFGPLRLNAEKIVHWLLRRRAAEKIVLVSLCKGGGEVKLALDHPRAPEAFRRVAVWVNLSGLLHGTPLVGWLFSRRTRVWWYRGLLWWRGYDFDVVRELGRRPGDPLTGPVRLPEHLRLISVVGFPLRRHLTTPLARRCFRRIAQLGPSDGAGILLADACRVPGVIYPVWGADHYLRPTWDDRPLLARLLAYLAGQLAQPRPAPISCGTSPTQ